LKCGKLAQKPENGQSIQLGQAPYLDSGGSDAATLVKVFCSVQYDPRRKSQHLVSLDLKPLVLMFYPMIVFCSELSLHSRLCSAVAISNETCLSHQSLVCPFPRKQRNEQESKKQCKPEQELTNESFKFQKNSHTGRFIDPKRATNR